MPSFASKIRVEVYVPIRYEPAYQDTLTWLIDEFLAIENERMIPQQAASTVTNVDDLESFIRRAEGLNNVRYLEAIDLPKRDRRLVMNELA